MATTAPSPTQREQIVSITLDPTGQIEVKPNRFEVIKSASQEVIWVCPLGDYFTIDFGNDSPFYESQFSKDCPCSGLVRRDELADPDKFYKYTVRVKGKSLDPDGVVRK